MASLRIGQRLLVGFGLVLGLLLLSAGVALWNMRNIAADTSRIVSIYAAEQDDSHRMEFEVQRIQRFLRTILLTRDPKEAAANREMSSAGLGGLDQLLNQRHAAEDDALASPCHMREDSVLDPIEP